MLTYQLCWTCDPKTQSKFWIFATKLLSTTESNLPWDGYKYVPKIIITTDIIKLRLVVESGFSIKFGPFDSIKWG